MAAAAAAVQAEPILSLDSPRLVEQLAELPAALKVVKVQCRLNGLLQAERLLLDDQSGMRNPMVEVLVTKEWLFVRKVDSCFRVVGSFNHQDYAQRLREGKPCGHLSDVTQPPSLQLVLEEGPLVTSIETENRFCGSEVVTKNIPAVATREMRAKAKAAQASMQNACCTRVGDCTLM